MQKAHDAPRCGAYARTTGEPCKSPAMANGRCRMHGGKSTGAPEGKANGNYRHGRRTQKRIKERRDLREFCRNARENASAARKLFSQFRQMARELGVSAAKLLEMIIRNDGGLEMLVIKHVARLESEGAKPRPDTEMA